MIVHRTVLPPERTTHLDLPITSPARTLLDIAAGLPARDIEYILEEGLGPRRLLTEAEVARWRRAQDGTTARARSDACSPRGPER